MAVPPANKPPATNTPALPNVDPVARPVNQKLRFALLLGVMVIVAVGVGVYTRQRLTPPVQKTAEVEAEPLTQQEAVEAKLQAMMAQIAEDMFGSPFLEMTPENVTQIEQVSKPYPNSKLETNSSSFLEDPKEGKIYRMVYTTPDSVDQVKEWFEKDIHPDYRTTHASQGGMKGYTIGVKVPGLKILRDIAIVAIPDEAGGKPNTEIWVTIRNTTGASEATP